MSLGLIGRKVGMTRVFTEEGAESDGYNGLQVTFGERRASRVNKAQAGHFAKSGVAAGSGVQEFTLTAEEISTYSAGSEVSVEMFEQGQIVDVTGTSIGKGFAGGIKRHHFKSNRATHGNSKAHRKPGSTGMAQDPGRIFPGKRMPGQLGAVQVTTQNLEIVRVDAERNLLLIKGAVPGSKGGDVVVRPAVKVKTKGGSK